MADELEEQVGDMGGDARRLDARLADKLAGAEGGE